MTDDEAQDELFKRCGAKWPTKEEADRAHEQMESDSWRRVAERLEAEKVELIEALQELHFCIDCDKHRKFARTHNAFNRAAELLRKHGG